MSIWLRPVEDRFIRVRSFGMTLRELIRNWLMDIPDRAADESPRSKDDPSVALIYTITKEALASQSTYLNTLATKASTLIAFAGGIFALLMGSIETLILLPTTSQILILISVTLFVVSVIVSFRVTGVHQWRADPNPEFLAKKYLRSPAQDIQLQLISNFIAAWNINSAVIQRTGKYLRFTFLAQTIAFVLLGTALFVSLL